MITSDPEKKLRVLILEDNPADAELMERQLRRDKISFQTRRTETRGGFVKALKEFGTDVILADYTLPKFDAKQALELAREKSPFLPFIVVTGSIGEEKAVACLRDGADDYLLKDRLARLGEAVWHAIKIRRLQAEKTAGDNALQNAAAQWRATFDAMNDAVCLLDEDGCILRCNQAMNRLLRLPYEKVIGKDCLALICGKQKKSTCAFNLSKQDGQRHEEETFCRKHWFRVVVDPILAPRGKIVGAVHVMTDISQQKESDAQKETALKALNTSEAFYRNLFENSLVGISQALPNGRLLRCNLAYARMYGYSSPAEIIAAVTDIGRELYADPGDREKILAKLKADGVMEPAEIRVRRRDGTLFVVLAGAREIRDADGRLICYQAEHVDVTPLKQTEAALRESEEEFRSLYENATIGMYRTTPDGLIVMVNPALVRMLGFKSSSELTKRNLEKDGFEPSYPRRNFQEQLEKNGQVLGLESAWKKRDGTTIFVRESATAIRAEDGSIRFYDGTVENISERRLAEESLREITKGLERSQHIGKLGSWDWDIPNNSLNWSGELFRIWGMERDFPLNFERIAGMIHPDDQAANLAMVQKLISEDDQGTIEFRIICPNGAVKHLSQTIEVVRASDGQAIRMFGIMQDISERKRTEEQLRASLAEKEVLLKEIHHRVKNNLQVISGLLSLQATQSDNEQLKRMVKESQGRIWTMALIHQTLYESGNLVDIDMADYIRNLTGNLLSSYTLAAMPPAVSFDLLPVRLVIDKAIPLALIVNELLINAFKHAFPDGRAGKIHISLQECRGTARRAPTENIDATPREGTKFRTVNCELIVADNGVGLPPGFDPGGQKTLGLQLVTMLAKQLGGTVAFESRDGASIHIVFSCHEKYHENS